MTYKEFQQKQEAKIDAFPKFWAFSQQQFNEGMKKLNVMNIEELCRIPGGGFIRLSDRAAFKELLADVTQTRATAMQDRSFLIDAIYSELLNHEYGVTMDPQPALEALGVSLDDPFHLECFQIAERKAWQESFDNQYY